jgi:hypothetical protein
VVFDEHAIAEDLAHHPPVARHAVELLRRELDHDGGLPGSRLKRCETEGNDGTRLAGCLKTYVPWPTGGFGLVMLPVAHASRPLALRVRLRRAPPHRLEAERLQDRGRAAKRGKRMSPAGCRAAQT